MTKKKKNYLFCLYLQTEKERKRNKTYRSQYVFKTIENGETDMMPLMNGFVTTNHRLGDVA